MSNSSDQLEANLKNSPENNSSLNFSNMIDLLELEDLQKDYLRNRWLDQVIWLENRAAQMRDWHRRLRVGMIIASALVPFVVVVDTQNDSTVQKIVKLLTVGLSSAVTAGAAIDEFFNFNDRWYGYRRSAELLKSQGWQFFQLSGMYREYGTHKKAHSRFTEEMEEIIRRDVEIYVADGLKQNSSQLSDSQTKPDLEDE
jgi:hypothetical protein